MTIIRAKLEASILRNHLFITKGIELSLEECLDAVSNMNCFKNWNHMFDELTSGKGEQ
ncbi:MAG TPA: hypothetical protein VNU45_19785 [Rummeliibacillus sp.]|nr:hypothetical protein [Rummeliibacillus sp.]